MFWLAIIGLIVVAVWGSVLLRYTGLLGGCLSVLIVGCCLGHPFYHVALGPLPITADRLLLAVLLALFFCSACFLVLGQNQLSGAICSCLRSQPLCVSARFFMTGGRMPCSQPHHWSSST